MVLVRVNRHSAACWNPARPGWLGIVTLTFATEWNSTCSEHFLMSSPERAAILSQLQVWLAGMAKTRWIQMKLTQFGRRGFAAQSCFLSNSRIFGGARWDGKHDVLFWMKNQYQENPYKNTIQVQQCARLGENRTDVEASRLSAW